MLKGKNTTTLQYIVITDTRYLRQFINFIFIQFSPLQINQVWKK